MNRVLTICVVFAICALQSTAQLSGIYTVPGSYTSIGAAIGDLNAQGVNAAVTINIAAGHTETAVTGGYTLNTITGASATNSVVFQKGGAGSNPIIYAYAGGTGRSYANVQDGVWRFVGTDYVTVDGIDIVDANINGAALMEFGFGFFKASPTNGCQYNTIKNCTVTLSRQNAEDGSGVAYEGSRGIDVVNALASTHTIAVNVTSAAGTNSYNKFYSNLIQQCNVGIALVGFGAASPYTNADFGNDIGGTSQATGNTIINFGGGTLTSSFYAEGVYTSRQYNLNVSYNLINNNNGGGVDAQFYSRGIHTSTAVTANVTINNNTITLHGGGAEAAGIITEGSTALSSTGTISISNNLFTNFTCPNGANDIKCIYNRASSSVLSILNNTLSNNSFGNSSAGSSSGTFYNILNSSTTSSFVTINNNLVGSWTFSSNTCGTDSYGIYNESGSNTSTLSIANNTVQGMGFTGSSGGSFNQETTFINSKYAASNTTYIDNNVFNGMTLNTDGDLVFIDVGSGNSAIFVRNNSLNGNFSKPGSGIITCIAIAGTATGSVSCNGNNFSNISAVNANFQGYRLAGFTSNTTCVISVINNTLTNVNSTSSFYGIYCSIGGSSYSISQNNISNITGANTMNGIYMLAGNNLAPSISNNTISAFTHTQTASNFSVCGIYFGSNEIPNVFNNRIYNLSTVSAPVFGIAVYYSQGINVHNNIIGDLQSTTSNSLNAVNGMYFSLNTATAVAKVYHNTVHLNAVSSSPTSFGSSALLHTGVGMFDLRNNILINNSQPGPSSGITAAFRSTAATFTSYASSSNNNIFYAGTPAANRLIYSDGTNAYQALSSFQATVSPSDNASFTENTPFASLVGTNPGFLHINTSVASQAESGGMAIGSYSNDIDGDLRYGYAGYTGTGIAPDVGADEMNGTPLDMMPPAITFTNLSTVCGSNDRTLTANIVDLSGVPATGTLQPRIYFRKNASAYVSSQGSLVAGTSNIGTWNFTISVAALGSVSEGDVISYFLIAQDQNTPAFNIGSYPTNGLVAVNVNTVTTPPTVTAQVFTVHLSPTVTVNSGSICSGNSFTIVPAGASTFAISGGTAIVSPTTTSSYSVTGTSTFGCLSSNVAISDVTVNVTPTIVVSSSSLCSGQSLTLNPSGAFAYNYSSGSNVVSPATNTLYYISGVSAAGCPSSNTAIATVSVYASPSISVNSGSICSGGSFTIVPLGSGTFTYSSGSAVVTPSSTTSYSVITSNSFGCQSQPAVSTVTVFNTPIITVNSATICSGSSVTIVPGGASSYSISGGSFVVSPLTNTSYSITGVSVNGCLSSNTAVSTISVNQSPTITVNSATICSGSSATIVPGGASSYSISGGSFVVSPLTNTSYSVTGASANGCLSSNTAVSTISVNQSPTLTVNSATVCAGQYAVISPSGAISYTVSGGSFSVNPLTTTSYSVNGTAANNCTSSNTVISVITVNSLPSINVSGSGIICLGQTATLTASGVNNYTWSVGGSAASIVVSPTVSTSYTVTGTDQNQCSKSEVVIQSVDACLNISKQTASDFGVGVYPNPNTGNFIIELAQPSTVSITNAIGQVVVNYSLAGGPNKIDIEGYPPGVYFISVMASGQTRILKLIKQ